MHRCRSIIRRPGVVVVLVVAGMLSLSSTSCGSSVLVEGDSSGGSGGNSGAGPHTGTGTPGGTTGSGTTGTGPGTPGGTTGSGTTGTGPGTPGGTTSGTTGTGTWTGTPGGTTTTTTTMTGTWTGTTGTGTGAGWTGCNIGNCDWCINSDCAMYQCEVQFDACFSNPQCIELNNCYSGCGFDPACEAFCDDQFPSTVVLYHALLWCMVCSPSTCSLDCGWVPFCSG